MSLPTNIGVYNQHNNLNQNGNPISYANSGGIYNNPNNKNEVIVLNINNRNIIPNKGNETKNNLQNITKERENNLLVNNIDKKMVQKSVYQKRNDNNYLFYDNERGNSYPLSDNSRNQMTINKEYLAKINKNYNLGNDPNIQKEQTTEIIPIAQPPVLIDTTGVVPIADTKFFRNDKKCTCRKVFMITVKVLLILLLIGLIILCCALILQGGGSSSIGSGSGGGSSGGGGRHGRRGNWCCCCDIYRWIKSDKWCSKD